MGKSKYDFKFRWRYDYRYRLDDIIFSPEFIYGVSSIAIVGAIGLGCYFIFKPKKVDCNIEGEHAHLYECEESGLNRYLVSEDDSYLFDFNRSDKYVYTDETYNKELLDYLGKERLYEIKLNEDYIANTLEEMTDHIEYGYTGNDHDVVYVYQPGVIPGMDYIGISRRHGTDWKNEKEYEEPDEVRLCHYTYTAYKVEKNDKGKYECIPCEPVENFEDIPEGYDYIDKYFYNVEYIFDEDAIKEFENKNSGSQRTR